MAAPVVYRHPCDATTPRSPEMDGRSGRHRDGWFAKEHGGATTKLFGSSRDACPRGRRVDPSPTATAFIREESDRSEPKQWCAASLPADGSVSYTHLTLPTSDLV